MGRQTKQVEGSPKEIAPQKTKDLVALQRRHLQVKTEPAEEAPQGAASSSSSQVAAFCLRQLSLL